MNDNDPAGGPGRSTRRTALRRAGAGALALSGIGSAGLTATGRALAASGGPTQAIATRDRPLTLPLYSDNKPIPSAARPEGPAGHL